MSEKHMVAASSTGRSGVTFKRTKTNVGERVMSNILLRTVCGILMVSGSLALSGTAEAESTVIPAAGPVFGLATAPDGSVFVTDVGSGVQEYRNGAFRPIAQLPGATDVAAIGRGDLFVITSGGFGGDGRLYRVARGSVREIADLGAFEATVNPDGAEINPNPFDVTVLDGGHVLVTDAGGNSLLIVDQRGNIDWVATLPAELVSTANIKSLLDCPGSGAPQCGLPPMIPAQAVATSIAIGPDGAYYVSELKGFPAPTGESRVWRIDPLASHAQCGSSPACSVVLDGFTSIIDLTFGPDGTLYVVELDESSWFALDLPPGKATGGTVNACNVATASCTQVATGLFMATAATVDKKGKISVVTNGLIPGAATLSTLP